MSYRRISCVLLGLLLAAETAAQTRDENDRFTRLARRAGSGIHWIRDPYRRLDLLRHEQTASQPYNPSVDRKVLLSRALDRARATDRLVLVYAFRIHGSHMYRGPVLDDYMNLTVFSDPELVELVNRKFIPLRLYVDRHVGKVLGVQNTRSEGFLKTVEPALLFVSPGGKVLHIVQRINTFSVHWMRHVLKEVLRIHPEFDKPSVNTRALREPGKSADALIHLAGEQCLDGNEEASEKSLKKASALVETSRVYAKKRVREVEAAKPGAGAKPREVRLWEWKVKRARRTLDRAEAARVCHLMTWARTLRLLRRGREALSGISQTRNQAGEGGISHLSLEAARIHLALGDWDAVKRVLKNYPPTSESEFLLGQAHHVTWDQEKAREHFHRVVDLGEEPWSYRAAAMIALSDDTTPLSPLAHGFSFLEYGSEAVYAPGVPATSEIPRKGSPAGAKKAVVKAALDYLLSQQRPDGSWSDTRYAYWPAPRILPNVRMAITALAATAVLAWWDLDPARAEEAVARAERYLRDDGGVALGTEEEVYVQAYRILYWVRKAAASPPSRSEALKHLEALVKRVAEIQDPRQGLFMHEYHNAFCTGVVLWSLHLAKKAGVQVPEEVLKRGTKALAAARREDGTFVYAGANRPQRTSGGKKKENVTNLKNASARMPLCEGVLMAMGASSPKKMRKAFSTFLKYLDRLEQVRKIDYHADGQLGGFFFWHALFHASEAKALLKGSMKKRVESTLLDRVTGFPEIDGSFIDDHELGKSYGTAMALLVLKNL